MRHSLHQGLLKEHGSMPPTHLTTFCDRLHPLSCTTTRKLVHADSKLEARVREAAKQSDKHRVVLSHLDLLMADINANLNAEDSCTVGFEDLCVIVVRTEVLYPFKPWA